MCFEDRLLCFFFHGDPSRLAPLAPQDEGVWGVKVAGEERSLILRRAQPVSKEEAGTCDGASFEARCARTSG